MAYVDPKLFVPGDVESTVRNILTFESLSQIGFLSNIIGLISFISLTNSLYTLLKPVDTDQARLMMVFVVTGVSITLLNMLNQFAAVRLLSGSENSSAFETNQPQGLAMTFLDTHRNGNYIAGFFWEL